MVILRRTLLLCLIGGWLLASAPPRRIVSTVPSVTELLYALGLGDKIVGVTNYCRYPPEAQLKPKIGTFTDPNLEVIAALRPDLVLTQVNPVRLSERLRLMKLNVTEVHQEDLPALYESFRVVGQATGAQAAASRLIESIRSQLAAIRHKTAKVKRTRVMFVVGRVPGRLDGMIVVGKRSYLSDVIEIAGGENIFEDAAAAYPTVSLEEVIARNPEVIIDMGEMGEATALTESYRHSLIALWQGMTTIQAVKDGRICPVNSDYFVVPGPRVVNAARELLGLLHPEIR